MDRHGHKQNKEHIVDTENFIYINTSFARYMSESVTTFVTGELRC
jgi:hypothetical protein